ncbi:MAG: LysR family transcriptional regulator [Lachnospiraceae bacterium]|nr:LysR family transcriptional regulator [Lachnospiraceae bacterium]MDD3615231.1 LysR family transcriptional regulator [Lachnospiraceae bacterium]
MNNRQLRIFCAVYEQKSMTAAARLLYMTQPAVSQTMKELEQHYQVKLFEMSGRQLLPTQAGTMLYEYAGHILNMYQEMDRNMHEAEGVRNLYVGANMSVGAGMLIEAIEEFQKLYPDIKVHAKIAGSKTLVKMIEAHELDVGFMEDLSQNTELVQIPFAKDRTLVVVTPGHPLLQKKKVVFSDLMHENFLLRETGAGVRDRFDAMVKAMNIQIEPLWECSNTAVLVKAVQAGLGISVLPLELIRAELENQTIVELPVSDIDLHRNLNIVYHPKKVFTEPLKKFVRLFRSDWDLV